MLIFSFFFFSLYGDHRDLHVLTHSFPTRRSSDLAVDGAGAPLPVTYARSEVFLQTEPGKVSWELAQVNHYNTRSWQDYIAKHDRGGGLGPERWNRDENWRAFNRKEEDDWSIKSHLPTREHEVAEMLAGRVEVRQAGREGGREGENR